MSKTADAMLLAIRTEHLTCDEPKCVACRAADEYEEALSRAPKAEGVDYEAAAKVFDAVAVCSGTYPADWHEQIKARDNATRAIVDAALGLVKP